MKKDWRYEKPAKKHEKAKDRLQAVATILFLMCLLTFVVWSLVGSRGHKPDRSIEYCEGWYSGEAFSFTQKGFSQEEAIRNIELGFAPPCPVDGWFFETAEEAFCEGLAEGYIGMVIAEIGPPPRNYVEDTVRECVAMRLYESPVIRIEE